ncbi:PREDICTED: galectin-9-like [Bactrocera latifrons]|uniref:galectin-9-like n=1 Tax=Bactrocera latifrons TaxID=174628 RepID=UPI0008DD00DF|nr:PREDICTED: galectin-9-like [Bactrocera latifrons]
MGNTYTSTKRSILENEFDYVIDDFEPVHRTHELGLLKEGVCFRVTGQILLTCERFFINFLVDNAAGDVALHLNARLPQNYIVRNSRVNKRWQVEQNTSAIPFTLRRGTKFLMQFLITETAFLIAVNGFHFTTYVHCIPYRLISSVVVIGEVTDVLVTHTEVATYPDRIDTIRPVEITVSRNLASTRSSRSGYAQLTRRDAGWRFSLVLKALHWQAEIAAPYVGSLPRNMMKPGRLLKIEGRVKLLPMSFYINLQNGVYFWPHPIIAFHLASCFFKKRENISKAQIVRCAWYDGQWSPEECSDIDTEFLPGKYFRLAIVCMDNAYEVYLNGKFLLEFRYHMRPEVVDTVYICGDVKLSWVSLHSNFEDDGTTLQYFTNQLVKSRSTYSIQPRRDTYRPTFEPSTF